MPRSVPPGHWYDDRPLEQNGQAGGQGYSERDPRVLGVLHPSPRGALLPRVILAISAEALPPCPPRTTHVTSARTTRLVTTAAISPTRLGRMTPDPALPPATTRLTTTSSAGPPTGPGPVRLRIA